LDVVFDSLGKVIIDAHWRWGPRLSAWLQVAGLRFTATKLGMKLNRGHASMPLGYIFILQRKAIPSATDKPMQPQCDRPLPSSERIE
jgi:hypothetical protein